MALVLETLLKGICSLVGETETLSLFFGGGGSSAIGHEVRL